jgi:hypothetical protein
LFKTRAGQQEMGDRVDLAKVRIRDALNALGRSKDEQSASVSCVWNFVGLGSFGKFRDEVSGQTKQSPSEMPRLQRRCSACSSAHGVRLSGIGMSTFFASSISESLRTHLLEPAF